MSLTFRHINKFASILSITSPRTHKFQHSLAPKQTAGNKQETNYSAFPDNRELLSDIIKKEQIYSLDDNLSYSLYQRLSAESGTKLRCQNVEEPRGSDKVMSSRSNDAPTGRPSPETLYKVYEQMSKDLPNFFYQTLDYSKYHAAVVFEDNIRNIRTEGIYPYIKQMALIRIVGHIKFAYVKMEVLKITMHPEEGTIKVRWRIRGVSAFKVMLKFWKYKPWEYRNIIDKAENWYDGFSTFYVNSEGYVVRHVAEKMMPDDDRIARTTGPPDLGAAKLALIVGLIPKFADFASLI